ncbi:MAG: hypothetical protein ACP5PP_05275 [Fervidobacterium sp.]
MVSQDKELLSVPVDDYILDKGLAGIDYEITASGEYQGLYYTVVSAVLNKERFEEDIKQALRSAPSDFALLVVEGDLDNYVESTMIDRVTASGVKLVSRDFSKKILQEQQKYGYDSLLVAKYAALSAARYLIYVKANISTTYLSDYKL